MPWCAIIDPAGKAGNFFRISLCATSVTQDHNYSTNASWDPAIPCNNIQYGAISYNIMHVRAYPCLKNGIFWLAN